LFYISVMTEITENNESPALPFTLPPALAQFVLQWGDLGSQWGVNRSVAQIHALLYVAPAPVTAEDIAAQLSLARSNVSASVKELLAWKLIRRVPIAGDRRDHYEAETDVWEIVTRIAQGRKEREIDPAHAALSACVTAAQNDVQVNPVSLQRLQAMLDFLDQINRWYAQMIMVPKSSLAMLLKMGAGITRLLGLGRKD
jgi:DNA-binding transcriptional regulator GbsR (MarR family)